MINKTQDIMKPKNQKILQAQSQSKFILIQTNLKKCEKGERL